MDPDRRRLVELTFREYIERLWTANPAAGDAGTLLALAARSQALVDLAGGADPQHDLPVSRWAAEAGPSARALARQTLTEWTVTGGPHAGATPAEITGWRQVCRVALEMIAS
jgi:hypothetical protein